VSDETEFQSPWNFLALDHETASPERARGRLLPVPYESTTSYGAGTRDGPAAIIAASRQVEFYDREFQCEPVMRYGIHTTNPLGLVHKSPDAMVKAVESAVFGLLTGSPAPDVLAVLGGEHTISPGVARALARVLPADSLVTVQVDAHADLRDEYEASPFSHACAARRILDACPVFQIGIRSMCAEEEAFRRDCERVKTVFAEDASSPEAGFLKELAAFVKGKNVYLTVDLDGLDPSIMPSVGTPEPGGISWERMLEVGRVVCANAARVPAFDVVELAPIPGLRAPDFLAAKLVYKLFSYAFFKEQAGKG